MTKEAYARESRRAKQNRIAVEADLAVGRGVGKSVESNTVSNSPRSTAPWDQPRNGTTITLEGDDVDTCTEAELIARIRQRNPTMKGIQIDHVNSRKPGFGTYPPTACLLISWTNPSYRPSLNDERSAR